MPGDRPDRFVKASASGADAIVLDLEDAVGADAKGAARDAVESWLADGTAATVRINGAGTEWHDADVAMVGRYDCAAMVPKASSAAQLRAVADQLRPGTPLVALVETAGGILAAAELCAVKTVVRAAFGSVDLGAELGVDPGEHAAFAAARSMLVLASAAAGLPAPLDGVTTSIDDIDCLAADIAHASSLGFSGKLCIHPKQVGVVNDWFAPSEEQLAWALRIADAASGGAVCIVDGKMVDKPVVERAERIIAQSERLAFRAALTE